MKIDEVLQEIMLRLVDLVLQGGKPEKIIVSDRVMEMLNGITLMPRSVQYKDSKYYIADIPVELGDMKRPCGEIWFEIN